MFAIMVLCPGGAGGLHVEMDVFFFRAGMFSLRAMLSIDLSLCLAQTWMDRYGHKRWGLSYMDKSNLDAEKVRRTRFDPTGPADISRERACGQRGSGICTEACRLD
jgi:hypothetical protein